MPGVSLLIIIVDDVPERARKLQALIEFMDVPRVRVAAPDNWLSGVGDCRLAAVFVHDDLGQERLHRVMEDVGEHDPNVPVVVVKGDNQGPKSR